MRKLFLAIVTLLALAAPAHAEEKASDVDYQGCWTIQAMATSGLRKSMQANRDCRKQAVVKEMKAFDDPMECVRKYVRAYNVNRGHSEHAKVGSFVVDTIARGCLTLKMGKVITEAEFKRMFPGS